jgi:hypothetical protein
MKGKRGGPRDGAGRKPKPFRRRMHLASCINDWAEEYCQLGRRDYVLQAVLDLYEVQYRTTDGWSAEDVAATGKAKPPSIESFLKTTKKDLRLGRQELRDLQRRLRALRRRYPRLF